MTPFRFYLLFSVFISLVPALIIGALVSAIDHAAGYAVFIGLFGWLLSNMLIRWFNRNKT